MKMVAMEVSPEDKVQKILNTEIGVDWDVYVTCDGRILRKDDKLKSCGFQDGSTVQDTNRMGCGGKHKDKKNNAEKTECKSSRGREGARRRNGVDPRAERRQPGGAAGWWVGGTESFCEEQFEALDKEMMMEKYRNDLESAGLDVLARMDAKHAEEVLMKFRENLTGIPEEQRTVAVRRLMWMARGVERGTTGGQEQGKGGSKVKDKREKARREGDGRYREASAR